VRIARHSKTGQYAAIKIIPKSSLGSLVSLNRLANEVKHCLLAVEREIVLMKLIDHPNVLKLYDVWETSSSIYLILEYVQGGELFEYLCDEGRRPVEEALDYFQQIVCAVDYCHRFNIAHRDLKLENILIDQNKDVKVADFGMAAWQDTSKGSLLRTSCGSPHYAAPEVISGKPYDGPAADIWSCGIILYALLIARLPFDDDDCPTLLQKIAIGKFDMPTDIDVRARDLISRMLDTDVTRRITMPDILRHPFFLSNPLKNPEALAPNRNVDLIAQRPTPRSTIDPDIFANLRTLWHGMSDSDLIEALTSPDHNWQKGIYHLLSNYRKKYLDSRREEEEVIQTRKRRKQQRQAAKQCNTDVEFSLPLRSGPPTPRRARGQQHPMSCSTMTFIHVQKPGQSAPLISLSVPSPGNNTPVIYPETDLDEHLSMVAAPDLEDEKIRAFFQQVANHLNILQARTTPINSPKVNSVESPPLLQLPEMPSTNLLLASRSANTADTFGGPPVDLSGIRPLSLRRETDTLKSSKKRHADDKENTHQFTESDLINRRSPLARHNLKMTDNRCIQPLETTPALSGKAPNVGNELLVSNPLSPHFSEAGSSFTTSSPKSWKAPKKWLDNVFKFKTATYVLLSLRDINITRSECRRLLMELGLLVSIEDSEMLGVLKCRSVDLQGANHTQGVKSLKFRVEMQWPSPRLCHEGYLVSLHFIQEKGSLEAFKGIFQQVARSWSLDRPKMLLNLGPIMVSSSTDEAFRY